MRFVIDKVLDFLAVWIQPFLAFVVLVSGALMSFDYKKLRLDYPRWLGLFDVMESTRTFWIFLASAVATLIVSLECSPFHRTGRLD